VSLIKKEKLEK